jgi:hypothetical protein
MSIKAQDLSEEIQEYISTNSSLGLNHDPASGNVNFTLGNVLNVVDLDTLVGSNIELTMFEEGGSIIPSGRRERQERAFRFVTRGNSGQLAINASWNLFEWLWNDARSFQTQNFKVWIPRGPDVLPSLFAAQKDGTHIANFLLTFFAYKRTG